ncbi:unnamed protein product [Paramecium pentaurelia]|uniref:Uncharacterized protein n=1 Tax=Paramecium pentaurelia TaxID=43138 RepID=A0A8S1VSG5_9CILI|nr:unnamed protein product [Paramecium pentaurelia]
MKRVSPKIIANFNTDPRSSQQSCHVSKSKPLLSTNTLQQQNSSSLIQSLNGLCKYFNHKEQNKQISYHAPKSIERSSASLSTREIIATNIQNPSPLLVKQLLYGKNNQKENLNSKTSMNRNNSKQIPHLSINQDQKLVKGNDSSHKKCMDKFDKSDKSINGSIQYQENWKMKYDDLQQNLYERIQQLEIELENMEKDKKNDQIHSNQQTNEYIEKLQNIVSEKDQIIYEKEQKNEKLQQIIDIQQIEIQKYKNGMYKIINVNEIQRLQQIDQKFQQIKGYLPLLNNSLRNIQQLFDFAQSEQQINNLSLSSFSIVEMINEFNQVIEESAQKSFKKLNQKELQFS